MRVKHGFSCGYCRVDAMKRLSFTRYLLLSLCHLIPIELFIGFVAQHYPDILPIRIDFVNYTYMVCCGIVGIYHWKDRLLEVLLDKAMARIRNELKDESFRENLSDVGSDAAYKLMTSEVDIPETERAGWGGKESVPFPSYMAGTLWRYIEMKFMSEKGVLAKAAGKVISGAAEDSIPAILQAFPQAKKFLKKYPLHMIFTAMQKHKEMQGNNGGATPSQDGGSGGHIGLS